MTRILPDFVFRTGFVGKGDLMNIRNFALGFLFLPALFVPVGLWAQGLTGSIVGTITDPASAVIPNARITVKNTNTNAEQKATTSADGVYRVLGLVPGAYTVAVEAPGFRRTVTSPQTVSIATPVRVDLQLEVGQLTEVVSWQAQSGQLNTEAAQLGRV